MPKPLIRKPLWSNRTLRRLVWASWTLALAAVFGLARLIEPSRLGYGSHLQLGLPPCGIRTLTGIPCGGCGLTTSFAHLVRGDLVAAWGANPWGVALFATLLASLPLSIYGSWRASPIMPLLEKVHAEKVALVLGSSAVLVWLQRAFF